MGKSMNGPDWTDVAQYLRTIEEHHKVDITLLVTPSTSYGGLPLSVTCVSVPDKLVLALEGQGWTCCRTWPHRSHRTLEGAIYGLAMEMDEILTSKRWTQEELPA